MAEFQDAQRKLSQTRAARDEAARALFLAGEQLKQVASEMEALGRWASPDNAQSLEQRQALEARKSRLENLEKERQQRLDAIKGELADITGLFQDTWSDPRRQMEKMDDGIPIMLFPLRLETRFKALDAGGADGAAGRAQQLWVRIYPDECLVDTFEETLSQTELHSATIFWREYFHAAGDEATERAAWRALVASHGSGRATWIIGQFRPLNPLRPDDPLGNPALELKPQSRTAGEVILVITADESLADSEKAALTPYWIAIWQAEGRNSLEGLARDALAAAVGAERAAQLIAQFAPYNLAEQPPAGYTRVSATVRTSFLFLPKKEDIDTKTRSWMQAAKAELLPERFVLLGYRDGVQVLNQLGEPVQVPFSVSPDPAGTPESQFQFDENGNLELGDEMRWMTDFDEAVRRGMGFRVELTPSLAAGFDRLFVLGIRLSADAGKGKDELDTLFRHHYFSRSGFSFLPQGAATNNTDDGNSAYSREDDADSSYDFVFRGLGQFSETDDLMEKRDGQWFAESLGLDASDWLKQVPRAGGRDQGEARAMNTALWPATLGYFMDTLLQPVFSDDAIYYTRWFFNRFVSGRGPIPAIRIGRQPYGILPAAAISRARWISGKEKISIDYSRRLLEQRGTSFLDWLAKFKDVLDRLNAIWRSLAGQAAHVGVEGGAGATGGTGDTDPHQELLDIVGLHPASVEFHQRYASTQKQEHNIAAMWQLFISWQTLPANELHNEAFTLLRQLGYSGLETPKLFDLFWKIFPNRLNGPIIQEGPLSEVDPLRIVTTSKRNYIEWLHEWARLSFETIRVQDGFLDNKWPNSLLYILLRHALELGYHDAGIRVLDDAQLLDEPGRRSLRTEPHFFQIEGANTGAAGGGSAPEKSRYEMLYTPNQQVTGDSRMLLADYLTRNIGVLFGTRYLAEQIAALDRLAQTPTARLERLLAEHLDCCAYRLDAWTTGLLGFQLASMRHAPAAEAAGPAENTEGGRVTAEPRAGWRKGIYLGAYGWLENVRPENKELAAVTLSEELDEIFNKQQPAGQNEPLFSDSSNEGYIHAPSVNHAVTAAVLRNGYIANATPAQPDLLKVNLSSERVRLALGIIEGIRNGQSLAALLGYQFERGLHDRYAFAESDQFIYPLRSVFPLYTRAEDIPEGTSIEAVQARNVVNGLDLLRRAKNADTASRKYPFGFPPSKLPPASSAQQAVLDAEVDRLLDLYDALADLAIAEGVHQVVMGNYDRAAATLDAYSQATFPPVPEVVQTPRSGIALTHRVGLQLDTNIPVVPSDNPRARAEPAINRWAATLLPDAARLGCRVGYADPATGNPQVIHVTQADLGLQALDLIYIMRAENPEARSELEDRIRDFAFTHPMVKPRPDLPLEISYLEGATGDFSFFEVGPLVRGLRALALHSRPLQAVDMALPTEGKEDAASGSTLRRDRVDFLPTALAAIRTNQLLPLQGQLDAVFPEPGPVIATILSDIDQYLEGIIAACREIARYGLPQTEFGLFYETKGNLFAQLLKKVADTAGRFQNKLDEYEALMGTLPAQPGEEERKALLLQAERLISTTYTDPAGQSSAQVLAAVQAKETAFRSRLTLLKGMEKTGETTLSGLLTTCRSLLAVADFDLAPVSITEDEKQVVILAEDIRSRARQLAADLDARAGAVTQKLAEHDVAADSAKRVQILTEAARAVFGEEFVLVPSFSLPDKQAEEWANAYASRAALLDYQKNDLKNEFPVDDWLYGVARVREKMHHLENLVFLAEALGTSAPNLQPIQLPHAPAGPGGSAATWMALEFPPAAKDKLERELLLYTAHYSRDFDKTKPQCGLLLDEWTEVIPTDTETTGVAFHFDKPNAEPPQAILLALPAEFTGAWKWEDLVDSLGETLDLARSRAVEPQQLDRTALSVFLPATILATAWRPITIAADLSLVNQYVGKIP